MSGMNWLENVPNARELLDECLESEQIRFSDHFNASLAEHRQSRFRVLKQLKRSRRAERHDYIKGNDEVSCYCFVAPKIADYVALTFFVAFEEDADGVILVWIQEFHP